MIPMPPATKTYADSGSSSKWLRGPRTLIGSSSPSLSWTYADPPRLMRLAQHGDLPAAAVGRIATQRVLPHQPVIEQQVDVGTGGPGGQLGPVGAAQFEEPNVRGNLRGGHDDQLQLDLSVHAPTNSGSGSGTAESARPPPCVSGCASSHSQRLMGSMSSW